MPLLIDCYNVLGVMMPQELAGLDERGLCYALAASVFGRDRITIVCDGAVKPGGPSESPVEGIELLYVGTGQSADPVIVRLIQENTAPKRLLVVTSDHELQRAARRRRCRVMESEAFVTRLARGKPSRHPSADDPGARDPGTLTEDQVTRWLDTFGLEEE